MSEAGDTCTCIPLQLSKSTSLISNLKVHFFVCLLAYQQSSIPQAWLRHSVTVVDIKKGYCIKTIARAHPGTGEVISLVTRGICMACIAYICWPDQYSFPTKAREVLKIGRGGGGEGISTGGPCDQP